MTKTQQPRWDPMFLRPMRDPIRHSSWPLREETRHGFSDIEWADDDSLEGLELDQLPFIINSRVEHNLRLQRLEEQNTELNDRLDRLESAKGAGSVFMIQTFAPEPYNLAQPISVTIGDDGAGEFIACFADARISTVGENEQEAFDNIKSLILDVYDSLAREDPAKLGPEPLFQLAVLRTFISGE